MAPVDKGSSFRRQSTMATMKMVRLNHTTRYISVIERTNIAVLVIQIEVRETYRAATEERTGEVKEIRIRNDPENTTILFTLN